MNNLSIKKAEKRAVLIFLLLTENQKWQDKRIRKTDVTKISFAEYYAVYSVKLGTKRQILFVSL